MTTKITSHFNKEITSKFLISLFITVLPIIAISKQKPNILFIISDDLTTTALSTYENQASFTPHIDKLASEGMLYTRSYCQYPVCGA